MVTKQDIIDYVMSTPENTNRAVLESLLENLPKNTAYEMKLYEVDSVTGEASEGSIISATPGSPIKISKPKSYVDFKIGNSEQLAKAEDFPYFSNDKDGYIKFIMINPEEYPWTDYDCFVILVA
jgi:hypothetical protein